jgi:hypothetical protein
VGNSPQNLDDEDLLGMVNASVIKITFAGGYVADFWNQVFPTYGLTEV